MLKMNINIYLKTVKRIQSNYLLSIYSYSCFILFFYILLQLFYQSHTHARAHTHIYTQLYYSAIIYI